MKLLFFFPIIGLIVFAARGWRYSDIDYTIGNVILLALTNALALAWLFAHLIERIS